ncbi:MAG: GatB/YqeY domain-containing protein [Planctomycetes bacterium]|nr:GatB/YqeY domain-containing protein [Planctomycetota bacterium]
MGIYDDINNDLKDAMKAGRKEEVGIYRMVLSEIKNLAIDMNSRDDITDEICIATLVRSVKTRLASIEQYQAGNRPDLVEQEEKEIEIISTYLPEALTEEELIAMVEEAITEAGATQPKDMGMVMKIVMPKTQGRADGKIVQRLVLDRLKTTP